MSLEEAKRIKTNYQRRLERLRVKSTGGDKDAAMDLMSLLAEMHGKLKELGYRLTDENESGRVNRLEPITQEWIDEQLAKQTKVDKLAQQIRGMEEGPEKDKLTRELILEIGREYDEREARQSGD